MSEALQELVFATGPIAYGARGDFARARFAEVLERELGRQVAVTALPSYDALLTAFGMGDVHVAWFPPALFLLAHQDHGASLLLANGRTADVHYMGVLFVTKESPCQVLSDLQRTYVAWVDTLSAAGYLFPRLAMLESGCSPECFFGEEFMVRSHDGVVEAVVSGRVDVGATFYNVDARSSPGCVVNTGWMEVGQDLDAMRPIVLSKPIPNDVICAAAFLPDETKEAVRSALLRMTDSREGEEVVRGLLQVRRFQPARIRDYDIVRAAMNVTSSRYRFTVPPPGRRIRS